MEKKALGRGLGALIPSSGVQNNSSSVNEIETDKIVFNPYQPRTSVNDEQFSELVNSIKVHGILQPILVRLKGQDKYELVAGERRLRAARKAGLSRIPVVIRDFSNEQSLQVALIENLQREDLHVVDAAIAYKRLSTEFGLSQEEMAFGLGKSRSSIANTIRILNLPETILELMRINKITEGHARAILSLDNDDLKIKLCDSIVAGGLSVRQAEQLAKDLLKLESEGKTFEIVSRETISKAKDPDLLDVENKLRNIFGTKINVVKQKDKGKIEIEFYSEDDFYRITDLLAELK